MSTTLRISTSIETAANHMLDLSGQLQAISAYLPLAQQEDIALICEASKRFIADMGGATSIIATNEAARTLRHTLRNHINLVAGYAYLLARDPLLDEQQRNLVNGVVFCVRILLDQINAIQMPV